MPSFIVRLIVSRKTRTGWYQIVSNRTGPYSNHFEYHPEIDLKIEVDFSKIPRFRKKLTIENEKGEKVLWQIGHGYPPF